MATSTRPQTVAQTGRCPRCLGTDIDHSPVETWCRDCGFVLEDSPLDRGPDWRSFADEDGDPEHAAPGNRNHRSRGLGSHPRRTAGDGPDDARRARIDRHTALGSRQDRDRGYATGEIHRIAVAIEEPAWVGERAKRIFRDLHETDLSGQDLDTIAAACVLVACREGQRGRTASEVAAVARAEERQIARRKVWVADQCDILLPPPDVDQRVRVVAGKLAADAETTRAALRRLDKLDDATVVSGSPSTLAAALLWSIGDWTQRDVARAAVVTPPGIRQRADDIE